MVGLPRSQQNYDAIWMIIDRRTKIAHFIAYSIAYSVEKISRLYFQQVVRLHGVPVTIALDRDSRFTDSFWESLQDAMGTSLSMSFSFHLQTNGKTERTN